MYGEIQSPRAKVLYVSRGLCISSVQTTLIHSFFLFSFRYIPVLMAQAKIYWDRDNYQAVEKVSS